MGARYFMGVDIGTYESKGALINEAAQIVAQHACPHGMESPLPGYAEHDAEKTWWSDLCAITRALIGKSGVCPSAVEALGVSTIAPCCLPVDRDIRPLRKAILYGVDVRAGEEIARINDLYGADSIFEKCGTPVTSQSAAAKILWIRRNEPGVYAQTDRFVTGSTYLVARLTGEFVIDRYTAAAWVPMYDVVKGDWADDTGLFCRREQLARCGWTHEIAGVVHARAASETGLAPGTKVITGTADAAAEAISVGVLDPGDMMLMYGSSIFIIHVVEQFTRDRRLWAGPYLFPGTYAVAAGMSTAGTLTRWFRDNFAPDLVAGQERTGVNAYAALADSVRDIAPGSDGLIVLPYLSGERTPINDPKARGMIFGLNLHHTRAHVYNACLEGVGYGIAQHFDIFDERNMGTRKVMAVGGGTKNPKWLQIVSDISGRAQHVAAVGIGAAYGDALLAALGAGFYRSPREIADIVRMKSSILPDPARTAAYERLRAMYAQLYEVTKDIMHGIS
ncbi:MAG: FGGY-family carbohydrate kinase [Clostridiales bacterium]|nr:FGGY-family carbohydrate kinase [Clostridiales bacterium]